MYVYTYLYQGTLTREPAITLRWPKLSGSGGILCNKNSGLKQTMRRVILVALVGAVFSAGHGFHDSSKCLEHGARDHDCCASKSAASCADSYVRVDTNICCAGIFGCSKYKYSCEGESSVSDKESSPTILGILIVVGIVAGVAACCHRRNGGADCCRFGNAPAVHMATPAGNAGVQMTLMQPRLQLQPQSQAMVQVPPGMGAGMQMTVQLHGQVLQVTIPPGVQPGGQFAIQAPPPQQQQTMVQAQPMMHAQPMMQMQVQAQPMPMAAPAPSPSAPMPGQATIPGHQMPGQPMVVVPGYVPGQPATQGQGQAAA